MAQIYVFGRVMHELTPKESQSKQPYVCFDLVERSGGEHPNFYQVWARGDQVARLTRLKVKKGSMIWLTGSQKLVDVRQKDGFVWYGGICPMRDGLWLSSWAIFQSKSGT